MALILTIKDIVNQEHIAQHVKMHGDISVYRCFDRSGTRITGYLCTIKDIAGYLSETEDLAIASANQVFADKMAKDYADNAIRAIAGILPENTSVQSQQNPDFPGKYKNVPEIFKNATGKNK